ncbi:MAG: metal ABC transporter solute-binding protein, Zn/Mn family [Verrucomicrobiales bacterium]
MKRPLLSCLALFTTAILSMAADDRKKPLIFVPVLPYEFVFEKIGGDLIEVHSIVGEGDDAHSYTPTPKQIMKLASADLICSGALGFESNYFVKIKEGKNSLGEIDLLKSLALLEGHCDHPSHFQDAEEASETGEHEHEHNHDDLKDPHVWLSVKTLTLQSKQIADVLKKLLPSDQGDEIDANLAAFQGELEALDTKLKATLESSKGKRFYVYHGAFAYFAQDYGLEQIAIESGNRTPTPKHILEFVKQAERDGVKLVFSQPQFDQTSANVLAEAIGGKVAILDPLEKDVFKNLEKIASAVAGK